MPKRSAPNLVNNRGRLLRLPMFSVPTPAPPGETVPPGWTTTGVTFNAAPVPASVPVAETVSPPVALTVSVWAEFRVMVSFRIAGLAPALIVMFPVVGPLSGALIATPPAPVRLIAPALTVLVAPAMVRSPAVVVSLMSPAFAVVPPITAVKAVGPVPTM